jgi:DNA-binding YbaB/EbfC family protein
MAKDMGGMGLGDMLKQAQQMSRELGKIQHDLKERVVEGTAGGGVVKVLMNGQQEVLSIKIDPEAVDPEDVDMLEDLITAGVNAAIQKSKALAQKEMGKVTGGMLPPGFLG